MKGLVSTIDIRRQTKRFPLSDVSYMEAELGGRNLSNWRNKTTELLLGCVCAKCNNGWMSQTESNVKLVIESILDNRIKAVEATSQAHIAVWAIKTAMTLEALNHHRGWFYTDDQRRQLRIVSAIPEAHPCGLPNA